MGLKTLKMFMFTGDNRGVSIYIGLMIMAILLTIVFGLTAILVVQIKMVRNMGYSVVAFYAAETGMEEALFNCTDAACIMLPGSIGNATYKVKSYDPGVGNCPDVSTGVIYCLKSIGTYQQTKRGIQITK